MEIRNPSLEEAKRRRYSVRTVRFEFLKLLDINVSCRAGSGMRKDGVRHAHGSCVFGGYVVVAAAPGKASA